VTGLPGFQIVGAMTSAREAPALLTLLSPTLMLLDLESTQDDAFTLLAALKEQPRSPAVIILAGEGIPSKTVVAVLAAGATGHLHEAASQARVAQVLARTGGTLPIDPGSRRS
jgi:DNA-binding NarL/FixJ family response regulator